jgi:hypothetical protein
MGRKFGLSADFDTLDAPAQNALLAPEQTEAASKAALASAFGEAPKIGLPGNNGVTLYQGYEHNGEWLRDAEVRELNGTDEEALAKVGGNWLRFVDVLIQRGTVSIGDQPMTREIGDALLIGDREALVVGIRIVTFGEMLEIDDYECPECHEKSDLEIDLTALPVEKSAGETATVALRQGHEAVVRYTTGADQRAVYANPDSKLAEQNTILLSRCVISFDGEPVPSSTAGRVQRVQKMRLDHRRAILQHLADTQPGPRLDRIEYTHDACGSVIKLPLSIGDLFLGL